MHASLRGAEAAVQLDRRPPAWRVPLPDLPEFT
jgi:hypothetical protein